MEFAKMNQLKATASEPMANVTSGPEPGPELAGALRALERSAQRARKVAKQNATYLIVVRSGQIIRIPPHEL
jgi:hypothetical protein